MSCKEYYRIKIKTALKEVGLLKPVATIYNIRWVVRHWKCSVMAYLRAHGYHDRRFARLQQYAGKHKGERCFIVCTGPSLILEDVEKLRDEYTFSMNSIVKLFSKTSWRPTYYVINDKDAYINLEDELLRYQSGNWFGSDLMIDDIHSKVEFIPYPLDLLNHSDGLHFTNKFKFSDNPYAMVYAGYTVVFDIIQFATYMGFEKIYLLGCDCNYNGEKRHFEEYEDSKLVAGNDMESKMIMTYQATKKYADSHGIQIYNATRGGKLEAFERINFDKLFAQTE